MDKNGIFFYFKLNWQHNKKSTFVDRLEDDSSDTWIFETRDLIFFIFNELAKMFKKQFSLFQYGLLCVDWYKKCEFSVWAWMVWPSSFYYIVKELSAIGRCICTIGTTCEHEVNEALSLTLSGVFAHLLCQFIASPECWCLLTAWPKGHAVCVCTHTALHLVVKHCSCIRLNVPLDVLCAVFHVPDRESSSFAEEDKMFYERNVKHQRLGSKIRVNMAPQHTSLSI